MTPDAASAEEPNGADAAGAQGKVRARAQQAAMRVANRLHADFAQLAEAKPPGWGREELLVRAPVGEPESGATPADRLAALLLDPVYHLK